MGLDVGEIGMPLDLGLDLKQFVARTAGRLAAKDPPASVDACIRGLEEERRKIEVFRRELPFCARLLAEVIEVMKEEAAKQTAARDAAAAAKADDDDKRKWMSTAQLWVDSRATDADPVPKEHEIESALPKPMLLGGGTPVPPMDFGFGVMPPPPPPPASQFFIRDNSKVASAEVLPVLPMMSSRPFSPPGDDHRRHITHPAKFATAMPPPGLSLQAQEQQARKTRRCWSTELHRQFVAALRQLGGPQVATPKQIREVMKVDGLTNDEVKSHLQKYRLHNQRTSPGSSSSSHPIMLVGDHLWAHQEHSSSHSRSPEGPLQFSGSWVAVSALTGSDSSEEDDRSEMISRALHL